MTLGSYIIETEFDTLISKYLAVYLVCILFWICIQLDHLQTFRGLGVGRIKEPESRVSVKSSYYIPAGDHLYHKIISATTATDTSSLSVIDIETVTTGISSVN